MEECRRRWPWLTSGDRLVLVLLCGGLVGLLSVHFVLRTGFGRPAPERNRSAQLESHVIDVNRAEWWELQALHGIGRKRAKAIIAYRPFRTVDDLVRVPGIGAKTVARLRPYLKAEEPEKAE